VGDHPISVALGDLDGDGDLAVANGGGDNVSVLLNRTIQLLAGDMNCDGTVNNFDVTRFILPLTHGSLHHELCPDCDPELADVNGDGRMDSFDITPFVHLLTGG
jgi:hypothetical protein